MGSWPTTNGRKQALEARPTWAPWHERLSALDGLADCRRSGCSRRQAVRARAGGRCRSVRADRAVGRRPAMPRPRCCSTRPNAPPTQRWRSTGSNPHPTDRWWRSGSARVAPRTARLSVIDTATGALLADSIPNTRASSIAWMPDNSGFWYLRYPPDDAYHRHVFFHQLGADPTTDRCRVRRPADSRDLARRAGQRRRSLLAGVTCWSAGAASMPDCSTPSTGEWRDVISGVEAQSSFFFHAGELYAVTSRDAPNGRVIAAPFDRSRSMANGRGRARRRAGRGGQPR